VFTRQHYKAIAALLKGLTKQSIRSVLGDYSEIMVSMSDLVDAFEGLFSDDNWRFDSDRFRSAIGAS